MSTTLSEKVDRLFRTHLSPRGREYTYREVAAAICQQDSATFSPAYFFDEELTEFPDVEVRLLAASRRETLRRMALTLLGLSDESLNAVLTLACRLRHLEGLPGPAARIRGASCAGWS